MTDGGLRCSETNGDLYTEWVLRMFVIILGSFCLGFSVSNMSDSSTVWTPCLSLVMVTYGHRIMQVLLSAGAFEHAEL